MKVVVTGGAGFIGSCFVWKLNSLGISDIYIVDELGSTEKWKNLVGKTYSDYIDKDDFLKLIQTGMFKKEIDAIVHLGACSSTTETDASYLMRNNYSYSRVLAEWSLAHKVRYIYASSAATYGDGEQGYSDNDTDTPQLKPLNMYGYSKHAFDLWVLKNKLQTKIVGLKFFNVYGPNEYHKGDMRSMVHKGYQQIKQKGKIRLFKSYRDGYKDGEQKRDFIYIKDAVEMMMFFLTNKKYNGIYNIGTGIAHTWNDLANAIFKALNIKPAIEYFPMPEHLQEKYQYFTQAEMTKLEQAGYTKKSTDFDQAIQDYIDILETTEYL